MGGLEGGWGALVGWARSLGTVPLSRAGFPVTQSEETLTSPPPLALALSESPELYRLQESLVPWPQLDWLKSLSPSEKPSGDSGSRAARGGSLQKGPVSSLGLD